MKKMHNVARTRGFIKEVIYAFQKSEPNPSIKIKVIMDCKSK